MALVKDYEIAQLEVIPDGSAFLALHLCIVDEGILASAPLNYRAHIAAGDVVADVVVVVNNALAGEGYPPLDPADVTFIESTLTAARANPGKARIPVPVPEGII